MADETKGPVTAGGLLRAAREKHGLHIAALAAAARLPGAKHVASTWLSAAAFSALTVWTFVQAAQGKPFLPGWF